MSLLFPRKCVLCRKLLEHKQIDLCHDCRQNAPEIIKTKFRISFVAGWTAVWYYKDDVRSSLLRYKFRNARSYAHAYGRLVAMKLQKEDFQYDILTWVPTGWLRRFTRGYDHVALLAKAVGEELGVTPVKTMRKVRQTKPQSRLKDVAARRANILGAYKATNPALLKGKRILLLDDIITTGATASECARVLLTAGAKEVSCAAVAAASHDNK
jgi:ComF family protein